LAYTHGFFRALEFPILLWKNTEYLSIRLDAAGIVGEIMLRNIFSIGSLIFFAWCIFLLCTLVAGQQKGAFWYALIVDMLVVLFIVSKIAQWRSRRSNPK
jgi:hypothetical protein